MGTICELSVVASDKARAEAALDAGYRALVRVDDLMSDYKPESEISTLSREGFTRPVKLSKETQEVLVRSRYYAELSKGAFDCTVGPLVDLWRAANKRQVWPTDEEIEAARAKVNYQSLVIDEATKEARLLQPEMRIDLGGIAKGYAEDLAAEAMLAAGAAGGRVNLGGQVLVFGDVLEALSQAAIVDPKETSKILYVLSLSNESLSTTADYERGKEISGKKISHVIDPRTGKPAEGALASMVLAQKGSDADALSKIPFLLGEPEGTGIVRAAGALCMLVKANGDVYIDEALSPRLSRG